MIDKYIVPIRLYSTANISEHWTKRRERIKKHKMLLMFYTEGLSQHSDLLPLQVILCRVAPRSLDYDNLVFAFKNIRDYISDRLIPGLAAGRADNNDSINFEYIQKKGDEKTYYIEISLIKSE